MVKNLQRSIVSWTDSYPSPSRHLRQGSLGQKSRYYASQATDCPPADIPVTVKAWSVFVRGAYDGKALKTLQFGATGGRVRIAAPRGKRVVAKSFGRHGERSLSGSRATHPARRLAVGARSWRRPVHRHPTAEPFRCYRDRTWPRTTDRSGSMRNRQDDPTLGFS